MTCIDTARMVFMIWLQIWDNVSLSSSKDGILSTATTVIERILNYFPISLPDTAFYSKAVL